jgi:hypothetical protein
MKHKYTEFKVEGYGLRAWIQTLPLEARLSITNPVLKHFKWGKGYNLNAWFYEVFGFELKMDIISRSNLLVPSDHMEEYRSIGVNLRLKVSLVMCNLQLRPIIWKLKDGQ